MGATMYHLISPHSFLMGVLWFSTFILLGLLMRKLKFLVKLSVVPLFLLLVLSVLRMLIVIERPNSIVILSNTIYPAIVNFARHELTSFQIVGVSVNGFNLFVCVWIIVTIALVARHVVRFNRARPVVRWIGKLPRDKYAESILKEIIGADKNVHIFRVSSVAMPFTTAFKPYIILPKIDLSDDELRIILLHEWGHIKDKDILTRYIVDIICYIFWWNPLVYLFRKNFSFVGELKNDMYAVSNNKDFDHYLDSLRQLFLYREKMKRPAEDVDTDKFAGINLEDIERMQILALRNRTSTKGTIANVLSSAVIAILFVASYMFLIQPAFWESPDVSNISECFMNEYNEDGGIFRSEENLIVDNEDGTFSLYIGGVFVGYATEIPEHFYFFPIRTRGED